MNGEKGDTGYPGAPGLDGMKGERGLPGTFLYFNHNFNRNYYIYH